MAEPGKVWLVGAGPGDPGLITVKGKRLLEEADVVLYDALSHPALLEHCKTTDLRNVGKRGGSQSPSQTWITLQLIELARQGKKVVRLKGGDSFLFARGAEEAWELAKAAVPFEVVPGLSSPVGTSAYAGIPLTHRDWSNSVTFITGSDRSGVEWSPDAWKKLATATATICVLMGMKRIAEIARAIIDGGRSPETPAAVVQWGARPEQRVVVGTLDDIAERSSAAGLANPAVIIVGEVVALREELSWFEAQPLFGKRILVPRAESQAGRTALAIRDRSATPVLFPVIQICDPPDPGKLRRAARELGSYDVCLFTSANGVERFFQALADEGLDSRAFAGCRVGVIGAKTDAALAPHGIRADVVAQSYVGEALADDVLAKLGTGRILVPRALVAREELPERLRAAGCEVDVVPAYETRLASGERAGELRQMLSSGAVDVAMFTSSSTVDSVVSLLGEGAPEILSKVVVASIGPITSGTLRAHGISVDVEADVFTVDGVLDAIARHARPADEA